MAITHICANIDGLLKNCTSKKLDNLFDMQNGEAKKELLALKAKGHKLIPSQGCKHFHPIDGCQCRYYDNDGNKIKNIDNHE